MPKSKNIQIHSDWWLYKFGSDEITAEFMKTIAEALKDGEKVTFSGLGTFSMKETKKSVRRHPKTGELITIPAKREPHFKPCKELLSAVSKLERKK